MSTPFRTLLRKRNQFREFSPYASTLSELQLKKVVEDGDKMAGELRDVVRLAREGNLDQLADYLNQMPQDLLVTLFEKELVL